MESTSTNTKAAANAAATKPVALLAIAHHVEEHKLLVPNMIDFDPAYPHVILHLYNFGSQRWVDSIHADEMRDEVVSPGWVRTEVDGRLPALGIKVGLRFLREAPSFLRAVQ